MVDDCPRNKVDEARIPGLYLDDAPGYTELEPRGEPLEEPLIVAGARLLPWRTDEGDILDAPLPRAPTDDEFIELVDDAVFLLPENLLELDGDTVDEYGPIGELTRPLDDANLLPFPANVAVIVGVMSVLVIVVAPCAPLRFGLNVGRFLDANGMITGVNDFFLEENVNLDFFLELRSSSC